jgi:biotin carboxyl carrier protein
MKVSVRVDGHLFDVTIEDINTTPVVAMVDGQRIEVWPENTAPSAQPPVPVLPDARSASQDSGIYAPIPGVIISVSVSPGDTVSYGQELCVLEAMKMKQAIRSPRDGVIAAVAVGAGQHVGHHEQLITYVD